LLSPAGIFKNAPKFVVFGGAVFNYGLSHLISHISLPNIVVEGF